MQNARYSCRILMKLAFSRQIFVKSSNITFHKKNSSRWSRIVQCGRKDGQDEAVIFCNFAKAPKNS